MFPFLPPDFEEIERTVIPLCILAQNEIVRVHNGRHPPLYCGSSIDIAPSSIACPETAFALLTKVLLGRLRGIVRHRMSSVGFPC